VSRTRGFGEDVEYGLQLVAEELFTNMVKYSPQGEPFITIELSGDHSEVRMVFQERGVLPFDPTTTQPRDFDKQAAQRRPGGLGVHLVRTYMDDFRYEHKDGESTTTVSKKLGAGRV
jgi:serine/threonine-protein kinase RsbW